MSTEPYPPSESHSDEGEAAREEIRRHLRDQASETAVTGEGKRRPGNPYASPADDIKLLAGIGGFSSAVKFSAELEADRKKRRRP